MSNQRYMDIDPEPRKKPVGLGSPLKADEVLDRLGRNHYARIWDTSREGEPPLYYCDHRLVRGGTVHELHARGLIEPDGKNWKLREG